MLKKQHGESGSDMFFLILSELQQIHSPKYQHNINQKTFTSPVPQEQSLARGCWPGSPNVVIRCQTLARLLARVKCWSNGMVLSFSCTQLLQSFWRNLIWENGSVVTCTIPEITMQHLTKPYKTMLGKMWDTFLSFRCMRNSSLHVYLFTVHYPTNLRIPYHTDSTGGRMLSTQGLYQSHTQHWHLQGQILPHGQHWHEQGELLFVTVV